MGNGCGKLQPIKTGPTTLASGRLRNGTIPALKSNTRHQVVNANGQRLKLYAPVN